LIKQIAIARSETTWQSHEITSAPQNGLRNDGLILDVSDLEKGIYIVKIGTQTQKLVIN
jgi:hypothetical protein